MREIGPVSKMTLPFLFQESRTLRPKRFEIWGFKVKKRTELSQINVRTVYDKINYGAKKLAVKAVFKKTMKNQGKSMKTVKNSQNQAKFH